MIQNYRWSADISLMEGTGGAQTLVLWKEQEVPEQFPFPSPSVSVGITLFRDTGE